MTVLEISHGCSDDSALIWPLTYRGGGEAEPDLGRHHCTLIVNPPDHNSIGHLVGTSWGDEMALVVEGEGNRDGGDDLPCHMAGGSPGHL